MKAARFIICEKTGQWAAAFRRALFGSGVRVYETRSLAECWEELDASPASFLALELTGGNIGLVLAKLVDLGRRRPAACAIVLAARGMTPHEWLVREAGAAHVLFSLRQVTPAARLARRHLARAPEADQTWSESIWARLPWRG
jgi:hypothetical protein